MLGVIRKVLILIAFLYLTLLAASYFAFPVYFFRPPSQGDRPVTSDTASTGRLDPEFLARAEPLAVSSADGTMLRATFYGGSEGSVVILIPDRTLDRAAVTEQASIAWHTGCSAVILQARDESCRGEAREPHGLRRTGDVIATIDTLERHRRLQGRVALWGVRGGSPIAVRAALQDPRVAAVLLEAPFASLRDEVTFILSLGGRIPGPLVALPVELALRGGASFVTGFDPDAADITVMARHLEVPTLLIPSDAAPSDQIDRICDALPEPCRFTAPTHAGPAAPPGQDAFRRTVARFLEDRL